MNAKRTRRIDDSAEGVDEFIQDIITKYKLNETGNKDIVYRKVTRNAFDIEQVVVDNWIVEITVGDKLVAMVYARRTNFNYTEMTFVDFGFLTNQ